VAPPLWDHGRWNGRTISPTALLPTPLTASVKLSEASLIPQPDLRCRHGNAQGCHVNDAEGLDTKVSRQLRLAALLVALRFDGNSSYWMRFAPGERSGRLLQVAPNVLNHAGDHRTIERSRQRKRPGQRPGALSTPTKV
jgi:hypothetical protein